LGPSGAELQTPARRADAFARILVVEADLAKSSAICKNRCFAERRIELAESGQQTFTEVLFFTSRSLVLMVFSWRHLLDLVHFNAGLSRGKLFAAALPQLFATNETTLTNDRRAVKQKNARIPPENCLARVGPKVEPDPPCR
jgi:hypothetical protein